MEAERCPTCNGPLPVLKTCAWKKCGKQFYWSDSGRGEALYCCARHKKAAVQQRWRDRQKEARQ